jgi:hypothetical protein
MPTNIIVRNPAILSDEPVFRGTREDAIAALEEARISLISYS